ncbi:MAG: ATP-binding protein [Planctomycetota bacterium]
MRNLIQYQRSCYEADNRETGIRDLWNSKNRFLRFFSGQDVALCGTIERVPLPSKYGAKVQKEAFKYRRDKTLVFCALAIVGKSPESSRSGKQICAPLVFFPARIVELKDSLFLEPNFEDMQANVPVLCELAALDGIDDEHVINALSSLPSAPWTRDKVHVIAATMAEILPSVDFTALSVFPELVGEEQLKQQSCEASLCCLPSTAMALLPNSPNTRGVLHELKLVAEASQYSAPLQAVLGGKKTASPSTKKRTLLAPNILSRAQERVAHGCRTFTVTLVIGPPGTGKSHTIASVALDHLANNKSVLIASRMDQAVNVVADKIEQFVGESDSIVRAGRKQHLRRLKDSIDNMLHGISAPEESTKTSLSILRELRRLDKEILKEEHSIDQSQKREIAWGKAETDAGSGLLSSLKRHLSKTVNEWCLSDFDGWDRIEAYQTLLEKRNELNREFIRLNLQERNAQLLNNQRSDLVRFSQAIRARSDGKQKRLFQEIDFSALLHAFPVWLCKLSDLANVLPLKEELFDLAILDEATQCDIASCLPLLQRAKRVVIVGDPKQLRHISFLSEQRHQTIAGDCGIDSEEQERMHFRRNSILDLASANARQEQIVFLDEHFRSLPGIIDFSNREFYKGKLAVMRQRPHANAHPANAQNGNRIIRVQGQRAKTGKNSVEAAQILAAIKTRIGQQVDQQEHAVQTFGVLSPFRQQVDYIAAQLDQGLSMDEMKRHDVLVGTAHTFQGEERDVMYLSLALDDASHSAAFRFLEDPNLLNVSITRARHAQEVYCSFDVENRPAESLLRRWMASIEDSSEQSVRAKESSWDQFRKEVVSELETLGIQAWKDFPVAGIALDLIAGNAESMIGIDLVGYPGELEDAFTLERYRVLHRCGLSVFPLSYRTWLSQRQFCVDRMEAVLKKACPE